MELTGTIIFFGAIVALFIWIVIIIRDLKSMTMVQRLLNEKIVINIMPGIIIFLILAISAGMAWG